MSIEVPSSVPSPTVSYTLLYPPPPESVTAPSLYSTDRLLPSDHGSDRGSIINNAFTCVDNSVYYNGENVIRIQHDDSVFQISCEEDGNSDMNSVPFVGHSIRLISDVLFIPTVDLTGQFLS